MVGKIGRPYGILGWMNIFSFTEKEKKIFDYLPWFFLKDKKWTQIQIKNWKKHKNNYIISIKEVSNRSTASTFTNLNIIINKNQLPVLKKNEYYWHEIIGYKVFNIHHFYLGQVLNLIRTEENDILIVKNSLQNYKKNILIPFIDKKIIKYVNTISKCITVDWNYVT